MNMLLLILYELSTLVIGRIVTKKLFGALPNVLSLVSAFLLGTGITIPVTYFLSILFSKTSQPILWGVVTTIVIAAVVCYRYFTFGRYEKISFSEIAVVIFSLVFSTWVMVKTFHGGAGGVLYVGSNNVFDFGFGLGIIRSFSWGSNIPMLSPFESGSPFFYHFFFYFFTAIWEYLGVPIVWAMNIPSILSFAGMLTVIYYMPQILAKQKPIVGWIAVLLSVTNSSLAFWQLVLQKGFLLGFVKYLWHLPAYPFAGPFDGSTISLYVTLNSFVNQRHLAFSIALGLLLYMLILKKIQNGKMQQFVSLCIGAIVGLVLLWNIAIFILLLVLVGYIFIFRKQWRLLLSFFCAALGVGILINLPNVPYFITTTLYLLSKIKKTMPAGVSHPATWNIADYLLQNLGLLPLVAAFGYAILSRKIRTYFFPFVVLFVLECALAAVGKRGFDQKFFSFLIIGVNALAAVGILWLWQNPVVWLKLMAVTIFGVITISGLVDLMPIKNEFAFPIVRKEIVPAITWIHTNTQKSAVFVSYADIIDPVVLAGRKNYFGFFGNIGWKYLTDSVRRIYGGDVEFAKREGVTYILVPKWEKNDFPYTINIERLKIKSRVAYNDADFLILQIN